MLESRQEIVSTDLIPVNAEVLPELLKNEDFQHISEEQTLGKFLLPPKISVCLFYEKYPKTTQQNKWPQINDAN